LSAEKEVVNFWLNRQGYFTINNLRSGNKDIGILALKFDDSILKKALHVEICCSITGIAEQGNIFEKLIFDRFNERAVKGALSGYTKGVVEGAKIENVVVLNSIPKEKRTIANILEKNNVSLVQFEDVISDVMKSLKTEYYKDDVIRTIQLIKFLLLQSPKKLVDVLHSNFGPVKRKEFIAELLSRDGIIKEFKKTNEERLAIILKQSMIKPEKLAEMLEKEILNRKTRKPFIDSLIEQEKTGKVYKKRLKIKKEAPLSTFFA